MAADLDRAGQDPGGLLQGRGHSGRAGIPAGSGGSFAGPGKYPCRSGEPFIVFRYVIYVFR